MCGCMVLSCLPELKYDRLQFNSSPSSSSYSPLAHAQTPTRLSALLNLQLKCSPCSSSYSAPAHALAPSWASTSLLVHDATQLKSLLGLPQAAATPCCALSSVVLGLQLCASLCSGCYNLQPLFGQPLVFDLSQTVLIQDCYQSLGAGAKLVKCPETSGCHNRCQL